MIRGLTYGFRVAFVCALGVITWLALTTSDAVSLFEWWDKGNHFFAFLVLSFLLDYAYPGRPDRFSRLSLVKWVALLAYGAGIEIMQWAGGVRDFELADILSDSIGISAYVVVLPFVAKVRILAELRGPKIESP